MTGRTNAITTAVDAVENLKTGLVLNGGRGYLWYRVSCRPF